MMKKSLMEALQEVPEPRKGNAIRHKLTDILMIGILCIICNGQTFVDMELFGKIHAGILKEFLELPYGIPSHDTFANVFAKMNAKSLAACFWGWTKELLGELSKCVISIDGKTIRRSKSRERKAVHVVTAFASELQLTLGQLATDEKSNEITAIPKLLEIFQVKGNTITIDAMGTQTDIAQKIIDLKGNYVLALKNNHPTLLENVSLYLKSEVMNQSKSALIAKGMYHRTMEKNHGRIETRQCYLCTDLSWLDGKTDWAGLSGIGVIISKREEIAQEPTFSEHYFLYSDALAKAEELLGQKRRHWAIENQLHWMLDVLYREDDSRARLENAAENLNILRKLSLQLMKQDTSSNESMRTKRLRCAYDLFFAFKLLGLNPIS